MSYEWLDEYLLSKKAAKKDFKVEWNATRYLLGDKMFCMIGGDKYEKPIITLKGDPDSSVDLRKEYKDIIAGYYMNKTHWNSIYLEGQVPDDLMRQLIDTSYKLVLKSLSKKAQSEIMG